METGKFSDNLRVTENGLVSGVDRAFKSSNSTFQNIGDRLNPLGKSVDVDILFLGLPSCILLTRVHDDQEHRKGPGETFLQKHILEIIFHQI